MLFSLLSAPCFITNSWSPASTGPSVFLTVFLHFFGQHPPQFSISANVSLHTLKASTSSPPSLLRKAPCLLHFRKKIDAISKNSLNHLLPSSPARVPTITITKR